MLKNMKPIGWLMALLALTTLACISSDSSNSSSPPPNDAVVVNVAANTSLTPWLTTAVTEFNASATQTSDGDPIYINLIPTDAGQAISDIQNGATPIHLWIPDDPVWTAVLAEQGNPNFQRNCTSIAQSPLVIAMWRDIAEALGWPGLPLGWLDIGSLAADPAAWNYYSGGELGQTFRLGHTHPGLSGSGASTLLALVQAAQSKTDAITASDIQQPIVQASVGAFEGGVSYFSPNTQSLTSAMSSRGLEYLSGGVMYESDVAHYGNGNLAAIYPLEGTFMASHPACIHNTLSGPTLEAALAFRDYLLSEPAQQMALANGLRPVHTAVPIAAPLDAAHGVDPTQPTIIFPSPTVDTLYGVQELWQQARKDVNLTMLLDTSGSMRGSKIEGMREAATQFVQQMGEEDYISIIAFSTEPQLVIDHIQVGPNRQKIINAITNLPAEGDTTLYDAIGDGAEQLRLTTLPSTTNALVVLSDGQDTRSYRFDAQSAAGQAVANGVTVFTIAYGGDADERTLSTLAQWTNGNYYEGDEASIAAIYEEMSAAFGGNVGIGR
jgi:Ca-activated chloride channel family protein